MLIIDEMSEVISNSCYNRYSIDERKLYLDSRLSNYFSQKYKFPFKKNPQTNLGVLFFQIFQLRFYEIYARKTRKTRTV